MNQGARRAGRGGRPATLTFERIVSAAMEILDAEGLEALTMRRLGAELGVAAMSVYRHVPNREAVLAAVVTRLFAEAVAGPIPAGPWHRAVTGFARAYRRMLLAHPRAVPLLATHPVDVEAGMKLLAGLLEVFEDSGVPREEALTVVQSVGVYVLGHALAQAGIPPGVDPADVPEADHAAVAFYDRWFDAGLQAMVSGFQARLAR